MLTGRFAAVVQRTGGSLFRRNYGSTRSLGKAKALQEGKKPNFEEYDFEHDTHMYYTAYENMSKRTANIMFGSIVILPAVLSFGPVYYQQKKSGTW